MKKKKQKSNFKIKLKEFFNSPLPIIVALVILCISLLIYTRFLIKNTKVYQFFGYAENISILNGTIYTGYDINYFGDSKIIYDGKDIELKEFEIGYYVKDGSKYNKISAVTNNKEIGETASLKSILSTTDFSFTETHKDANFISDYTIKNLDKLVFKIYGKDKKDDEIEIEVKLDTNKVNK